MKKLVLFVVFGLFMATNYSVAQCSHAAKTAETKQCVKPSEAALKAASMDASIETKVCENSGAVCFKKKTVGADGVASYAEVKFDESTAQFVAIPAGDASMENASTKKSCAKACCAKGGSGKACCSKSKGTASATNSENVAPAQPAKSE
ncbi:MAG: hypothetical protein IPM92_04000 [Saprospiraceae bacterium]|nr:hypothetical protein [Saprospiraceae bacterium]